MIHVVTQVFRPSAISATSTWRPNGRHRFSTLTRSTRHCRRESRTSTPNGSGCRKNPRRRYGQRNARRPAYASLRTGRRCWPVCGCVMNTPTNERTADAKPLRRWLVARPASVGTHEAGMRLDMVESVRLSGMAIFAPLYKPDARNATGLPIEMRAELTRCGNLRQIRFL